MTDENDSENIIERPVDSINSVLNDMSNCDKQSDEKDEIERPKEEKQSNKEEQEESSDIDSKAEQKEKMSNREDETDHVQEDRMDNGPSDRSILDELESEFDSDD